MHIGCYSNPHVVVGISDLSTSQAWHYQAFTNRLLLYWKSARRSSKESSGYLMLLNHKWQFQEHLLAIV